MKLKLLLLVAGLTLGLAGANAQKGVDAGTRFGSGEDSVRCITNISLFVPYAKAGNFKDAEKFWRICFNECPLATKDIYLYGVRIIKWKLSQTKDATKRAALIDELLKVYDQRVEYFGSKSKKYDKDWIVSQKAKDYMQFAKDKMDINKTYGWLKEIVYDQKENCEPLGLYLFSSVARMKYDHDTNYKEQYIDDFFRVTEYVDKAIETATQTNDAKEERTLSTYKETMNNTFATSGAADCETLQNMYAPKIEKNKDDLEFLKKTISMLRRVACQDIEAYFTASGYVYQKEKTTDAAIGLGKQAIKKNDYATAMKFFEEGAKMATDEKSKSDLYYMLALLQFEKHQYSQSRSYCRQAIEADPTRGEPYILIGKMYATTASSIYPKDNVLKKAVYYSAIDKFIKAKQVDKNCTEEANTLITLYSAHLPSKEDIFMHPDLTKGKAYTIGGWISERIIIR
ncbi:MAG: hypothetical protein M0P33_04635 [Massilibacteroides sp.]|nr:hypothetical protein [Massilibacteroides sp.]